MLDMFSRSGTVGSVTVLLGLLLASSGMGCKGPTGPSDEDRASLYTGRWSGNINGFQVVLDIQAEWVSGPLHRDLHLEGIGTALNPTTTEMHQLSIFGSGRLSAESRSAALLNIDIAREIGAGGVILSGGQHTGQFHGDVLGDGRTWPGRFTSTTYAFAAPIFGPGDHPVTLIKQ